VVRDRLDGGPAFPNDLDEGLSLRDYFAAQAVPQLIDEALLHSHADWSWVSRKAYDLADAMLAERQRCK